MRPTTAIQQQQQQWPSEKKAYHRGKNPIPLLERYSESIVSLLTLSGIPRGGGADENHGSNHPIPWFIKLVGETTSAVVALSFYAVLAWKRDSLMVAFFVGAIINAILSKILKRMIGQSRPENNISLSQDEGMPSSHAMSLSFIGIFLLLHIRSFVLAAKGGFLEGWLWYIGACVIPVMLFTAISLFYRVKAQLHTKEQVLVGYIIGSIHGSLFHSYFLSNVMKFFERTILDERGLLPISLLLVPVLIGALVVGSVERRIAFFIRNANTRLG